MNRNSFSALFILTLAACAPTQTQKSANPAPTQTNQIAPEPPADLSPAGKIVWAYVYRQGKTADFHIGGPRDRGAHAYRIAGQRYVCQMRPECYPDNVPKNLREDEVCVDYSTCIEEQAETTGTELGVTKPSYYPEIYNFIPKGWTLVEDVKPTEIEVQDLEFIPFLEAGESGISGRVMRERSLKLMANLGLDDAIRVLKDQTEIPAVMQDYFIIFPGTTLRDLGGSLNVPYLRCSGGRWYVEFDWLDHGWYSLNRLARIKAK